jgi:quercetin dioxygenase-like cupin family protein
MKRSALPLSSVLAVALSATGFAETVDAHKVFLPDKIEWASAPAALAGGAEAAVLDGDPQKPGMFTMRLKMPKGYAIAPHMHPRSELVTVISGRVRLGLGQAADHASVEPLPAAAFFSMPQGVVHYLFVDEETVLQLSGVGPWSIEYANPKDDPRLNVAPQMRRSEMSPPRR